MNKRGLSISLLILFLAALLALVFMRQAVLSESQRASIPQGHEDPSTSYPLQADPLTPDKPMSPRLQGNPSGGLSEGAKPAPQSFKVEMNGEIHAGETLVMGGYQMADGSHEFTFITPKKVRLEDGREAIEVHAKVLALSPEMTRHNGLDAMAKQQANANLRAEAWNAEELRSTLIKSAHDGASIITSPKMTALSGQPVVMSLGHTANSPAYSIAATVKDNGKGGFSIDSLITRSQD